MGAYHRFILFEDRTGTWCAAPPGFRDPVVDPVGWGATREEAVLNLTGQHEFQERAHRECWPDITIADFIEVPEPTSAGLEDDPKRRRKTFRVIIGAGEKPR
jgi:hypothetical protein